MNILSYNGKQFNINAETAVHFFTTYGFPREIFEEQVNEMLKDQELMQKHKLTAYNTWKNQ